MSSRRDLVIRSVQQGDGDDVEALGVHRSSWRRGIGRALMAAAEAWAHDQGAEVMKLDTSCRSPVSVPFHESLGYDREAIVFRKPL